MSESTNGTATVDTAATGVRNRLKPTNTKADRLWAIMGRAQRKTFSLKREVAEGVTYNLKLDGMPATLDVKGVSALAANVGGKLAVKSDIGHAAGSGGGVVLGTTASEAVTEMTAE